MLSPKVVSTAPIPEVVKFWKRPARRYCPCMSMLAAGMASRTGGCSWRGTGMDAASARAGRAHSISIASNFLLPMQSRYLGCVQAAVFALGQVAQFQGSEPYPLQVYHPVPHHFQHAADFPVLPL